MVAWGRETCMVGPAENVSVSLAISKENVWTRS